MFPFNSRYSGTPTTIYKDSSGKKIPYLRRRFIPQPERFDTLSEYSVTEGDRLDNIAARAIGDPELFWRICDSNRAMRPNELTAKVGRRLRITLPEGIPGTPND